MKETKITKSMAETKRKKTYNQTDILENINALYGKIPPQSPELEQAVLGALLIQPDSFHLVVETLKPESFYDQIHQEIYRAIQNLGKSNRPIDIITVAHELKAKDKLDIIGGELYLSELTNKVASTSHLEFHAKLVQQKYIQRELIKSAIEIQQKAYEESEDVDELLNFAESEIFNISQGTIKSETVQINSLVAKAISEIEEASKNKNKLLGVPSGFTAIDRYTSGWQKSDLVIIAARPSMGKTAFVLSMTRNMAVQHNRPIAFFSLEMSSLQLVNRLMSAESEIPNDKLRTGDLSESEWQQLENKLKLLEASPIFIDDTPAISIFELRAKLRRLVKAHNIQCAIIDYLQLMTAGIDLKGNREQEVSTISRSLKSIAKELNIPILALSQLNRSVESRSGDKRPQLSDLRESGAIEQDADMVLFIHRPEYYGITADVDGKPTTGLAEIIIAKHRNGATGSAYLKFIKQFAKFSDYEEPEDYQELAGNIYQSKINSLSSNNDLLDNNDFDSSFLEKESPF
ncbi:MAG TPA: replicative DNA helicase [Bacteroidales bacterium]|nr:replicative DNA helicase [Bacteroidales bacterium]HRS99458.1 replicative DNA helicase [Bacteroidales bacterium]HUM33532.1 replicative DNA helicase [Bacteroidales bacterium]